MVELLGAVDAVCSGADGRLFLGRQDGFHLDRFTSGSPFSQLLIERWRCTLERRGREFARRGIPYVFLLVPDAPSVCAEDLPDDFRASFRPPGEIFLEAMGDVPGVTFIYPLQAMRQAKGGLEVYRKKDSHWTCYGSFVAYQAFMAKAASLVPCHVLQARDVRFAFRRGFGDLGSQMDPEQFEESPIPSIAGPALRSVRNGEGVGRQTASETESELGIDGSRALVFRDSFMTDFSPYLARSYSNLLTLGTTTRVMFDVVETWQPTIVVSQVAERKLFYHGEDHQIDGFETIYHPEFRPAAGGRLLRAMLLRGEDSAAAKAIIADHVAELQTDPVHAFSVALIMEGAGDIDAAERLIEGALRQRPDQPSFNALAARIALAKGRLDVAVSFAAAAARLAPYNGYFHELYAYCLVQAAGAAAAVEVLGTALEHVTDHPNLWYWASVCHAAVQQMAQARAAIDCALALVPNDPAYLAQKEHLRGVAH